MSDLRNQLHEARAEYRAAKYGGDLAAELLKGSTAHETTAGAIPVSQPMLRLGRMLAWSAAVAALLAVVFWWPRPTPKPRVAVQPVPKIIQPIDWDSTLTHLPSVPVGAVVSEVRSGMNEAVAQIGQNVNGALEAPVVTGGVAAVRHVAGELQEFASVTWDQLRPRQGP